VNRDKEFVQLQFEEYIYYWPSRSDWSGLSWMHQEVFVPASNNFHAYEFGEVKIYPGDMVIDAGASEGFFTRYTLNRGASIFAMEPVESLSNALKKTYASEIAKGLVKVLPFALGSKSGKAKLDVRQDSLCESRISNIGAEVHIKRLDDVIDQERIDFIKMDIEGSEMDAISGASKTIAKFKPRLSIAVYHELGNARKVIKLLKAIQPEYHIVHRGIYAWEGCHPRPFMVYAW